MNNILRNYFLGAAAYGATRKLFQLWDAKTSYYSECNEPMKPMPLGDKLGVFAASIALAPYLSPMWVLEDINYMDVYLSGRDPKEFFKNNNKCITGIDYIFM
jgi:hypothetical protein